jgi:hypothetical protein
MWTSSGSPSRYPNGNVCVPKGSLAMALRLLVLYAEKEPIKFERAALRWPARYVTEGKMVSLLKAQLALAALAELRAGEREAAAEIIMELARR